MLWFPGSVRFHSTNAVFFSRLKSGWSAALWLCSIILPVLQSFAAEDPAMAQQILRGRILYLQKCILCHQSAGQGTPGVFPPLAKSDFLMADPERSIRAICEGLSGRIVVNGAAYNNYMPPVALNDAQVADVLTFVRNSWGNQGAAITAEQVGKVRAKTQYPTYEALVAANSYAPLPTPPAGFGIREVVQLPNMGVRMVADAQGRLIYTLCANGDVWRVDLVRTNIKQILAGTSYLDPALGDPTSVGLALDSQKRFYLTVNQRDETVNPVQNRVTIFRTTSVKEGDPAQPKPWFTTNYPWGVGPFNHGVGHVAIGPDGKLYVSSGSRTDGNEPGKDPKYARVGEVEITAGIWRLDPETESPRLELFSRGLRNAYGFCWTETGEMFATDNGPDAHAPEELNRIQEGRHYGFPFQFSDWNKRPYPHTPKAPKGQQFVRPVINLGPAAGAEAGPISTFDPHSSPAGIVFAGAGAPAAVRGSLLVTRFGNLLATPRDVGFDLLKVTLTPGKDGKESARVETLLAPLARPIDVVIAGGGKIYILEFSRSTTFKGSLGLPGRILELAPKL